VKNKEGAQRSAGGNEEEKLGGSRSKELTLSAEGGMRMGQAQVGLIEACVMIEELGH
jgi:hypothetical protein